MSTKKIEVENFLYEKCAVLNECEFCKRFGYNKNCPVKNLSKDRELTENEVSENMKLCKNYVMKNLKESLT